MTSREGSLRVAVPRTVQRHPIQTVLRFLSYGLQYRLRPNSEL